MGICQSRKIERYSGDAKRMETLNPDNVKYLKRWQEKYDFVGRLDVKECEELVKAISEKGKEKGKSSKDGLLQAKLWLIEARARQAGIQRKKIEGAEKVEKKEESASEQKEAQQSRENRTNIYPVLFSARDPQGDNEYVPYGLRPDPLPYPVPQPPPPAPPTAPPPPVHSPHNPFLGVNVTPRKGAMAPRWQSPPRTRSGTVYGRTTHGNTTQSCEKERQIEDDEDNTTLIAPMIELPNPRAGLDVNGVVQPLTPVSIVDEFEKHEMTEFKRHEMTEGLSENEDEYDEYLQLSE
ncbi:hypothetical protein GBF38_022602 [Nibea albiflora]|uniref:Uncharacterized protein n=1 Tax=Nibea albiflora TaxID=240163 RepID=A0ACB7EX67_NIBAL|nr:hypothetical protein GBF38_022602 [Nibea albiflora]